MYLFYTIWIIKALESLFLFSHGDALSYHLVWPKLIIQNGIHNTLHHFFPVWLSGYFDFIYFIPNLIFGAGERAQQSSQFLHFFFSIGLGSITLTRVINDKNIRWLAGLSLLTISESVDFFLYAKNDGFIAFCSLISFLIMKSNLKHRSHLLGVVFGIAIGTKLSALFFMIPMGVFYFVKSLKKNSHDYLYTIMFTLLGVFPILFLKYHYLGSPLFPSFLSFFPGKLSVELRDYYDSMLNVKPSLSTIWRNVTSFYFFKISTFLALVFNIARQYKEKSITYGYYMFISCSLIFYLALNGGIHAPRFYFSAFFVLTFLAFDKVTIKYPILFLMIILSDSKIDKSLRRVSKVFSGENYQRNLIPRSNVWTHIPENSKVIAHAFTQMYYAKKGITMQDIYSTPLGVKFRLSCVGDFDYAILPRNWKPFQCLNNKLDKKVADVADFSIYQLLKHSNSE